MLLIESHTDSSYSRIRHLQDLPQPRHRAQQGREPSVLRHLQLLRLPPFRHRHQDRFLRPSRQEKASARLNACILYLWLTGWWVSFEGGQASCLIGRYSTAVRKWYATLYTSEVTNQMRGVRGVRAIWVGGEAGVRDRKRTSINLEAAVGIHCANALAASWSMTVT
jgi:hypothetical protein